MGDFAAPRWRVRHTVTADSVRRRCFRAHPGDPREPEPDLAGRSGGRVMGPPRRPVGRDGDYFGSADARAIEPGITVEGLSDLAPEGGPELRMDLQRGVSQCDCRP